MASQGKSAARKWSGRQYSQPKPQPATAGERAAQAQGQEYFLNLLRSRAPGFWTDDRREQARHDVGAVHVAIKVLGDAAAACQVKVKRYKDGAKADDGEDASEGVPRGHPLERLVRRPNREQTGGMMRRQVVQQVCLTGHSLLWHLRDGTGTPAEMWPVLSSHWQPVMPSPQFPEGGYRITPYYSYGPWAMSPSLMSPMGTIIPSEEIVRVGYPHPYMLKDNYSPLTACALQLDALDAVDRSRWHTMQAGANPSAVVELDGSVAQPDQAELDRLKEEFAAKYGGPQNAGRVAVLSPGAKLTPWSHAPGDMGWEGAWSQLVDFVLSVFGITKTLAFMGEASSYAALYASLKQFAILSLMPLMCLIADTMNVQLVWPCFGEDYFVEFEPQKIDDEDLLERQLGLDSQLGLRTVNEFRILRGLKPVEWGEVRAFPGQAATAAQAGLSDLDPSNDAGVPGANPPGKDLEQVGPPEVPPGQEGKAQARMAGEARRAMPTPGRLSRGSLPGMGAAGLNGNGKGH